LVEHVRDARLDALNLCEDNLVIIFGNRSWIDSLVKRSSGEKIRRTTKVGVGIAFAKGVASL